MRDTFVYGRSYPMPTGQKKLRGRRSREREREGGREGRVPSCNLTPEWSCMCRGGRYARACVRVIKERIARVYACVYTSYVEVRGGE